MRSCMISFHTRLSTWWVHFLPKDTGSPNLLHSPGRHLTWLHPCFWPPVFSNDCVVSVITCTCLTECKLQAFRACTSRVSPITWPVSMTTGSKERRELRRGPGHLPGLQPPSHEQQHGPDHLPGGRCPWTRDRTGRAVLHQEEKVGDHVVVLSSCLTLNAGTHETEPASVLTKFANYVHPGQSGSITVLFLCLLQKFLFRFLLHSFLFVCLKTIVSCFFWYHQSKPGF